MTNPLTYVLVGVAIVIFGLTCFYIAATVHSGSTDIGCLKGAFNQFVTQIHNHQKVTTPKPC